MLSEEDPPPIYESGSSQPLPLYTSRCRSSECILQLEAPRISGCPTCDWIYETKHMKINLGSRAWGLHGPTYGRNANIEGVIKFSGDKGRVESVDIVFDGKLRTTVTQKNTISGDSILPLVSKSVSLYHESKAGDLDWDIAQSFSIPIPAKSDIRGRVMSNPPSYFSYHQNMSCDVSYTLKFLMIRRGHGLKKHESKTVQILYLPKTYPTDPLVISIPRPPRRLNDAPPLLHAMERVKTINISPYYSCTEEIHGKEFLKCCHLSVPHPQTFSSGQMIPFTLSIVFPEQPAVAHLLTHNIRIQLLRRMVVWRKGVLDGVQRDVLVSTASLRQAREYNEGITMLRGEIQAGDAGRECSWGLKDYAEVKYLLRIALRPPNPLSGHIPSFRHEEVLEITTDEWGTLERELSSTGGTPTPAVGLAINLRRS
ncbi:hypothetical protein BDQ17DRAFT_1426228 [Cyathus striatus]|nr:hypothetical protein BDQ17DRAFT_1426228 [Cyathus striatus]